MPNQILVALERFYELKRRVRVRFCQDKVKLCLLLIPVQNWPRKFRESQTTADRQLLQALDLKERPARGWRLELKPHASQILAQPTD